MCLPCDVDVGSSSKKLTNTSQDDLVRKEHNEVALGSERPPRMPMNLVERDSGKQGFNELNLERK